MPSKMQSEKKDFFKKIGESFHNNLVQENRYKLVLDGLAVTVIISLLAAILGTVLAGGVCFMRMSASRFAMIFAFLALSE